MSLLNKVRECLDLQDKDPVEYVCPEGHPIVYKITRKYHASCPPVEFGECIDPQCKELVSLSDYVCSDPIGEFDFSTPDTLERRILYIKKGVTDDE